MISKVNYLVDAYCFNLINSKDINYERIMYIYILKLQVKL
jgi:hypothetical protein